MAFVWEMLGLCQAIDFERQFSLTQPMERISVKSQESGVDLQLKNYVFV